MNAFADRHGNGMKIASDSGQSTVEYLVVTFMLVAILLYPSSIWEFFSVTLKNKYHSYVFGVSVSDPPRKEFDDRLAKGAEEIEKALDILKKVEHVIEHPKDNFPIPEHLPSLGDIKLDDLVDDIRRN